MNIKYNFNFKLKRRKLIYTAGAGAIGYFVNRIFPFHFGGKKRIPQNSDVIVKINPKAVSRNKTGNNDV